LIYYVFVVFMDAANWQGDNFDKKTNLKP